MRTPRREAVGDSVLVSIVVCFVFVLYLSSPLWTVSDLYTTYLSNVEFLVNQTAGSGKRIGLWVSSELRARQRKSSFLQRFVEHDTIKCVCTFFVAPDDDRYAMPPFFSHPIHSRSRHLTFSQPSRILTCRPLFNQPRRTGSPLVFEHNSWLST